MRTATRNLLLSVVAVTLTVCLLSAFVRWVTPGRPPPDDEVALPRQRNPSCRCLPPCRCAERAACPHCGHTAVVPTRLRP